MGNCIATGSYNTKNGYVAFDIEQTLGVWASAHEISGPSSSPIGAKFPTALTSLSCVNLANCVAVGSITRAGTSVQQPVVTQETAGVWSSLRLIKRPVGAIAASGAGLNSVSCVSVGNCLAVGAYAVTTKTERPLAVTEKNGVWSRALAVNLPSDAVKTGVSGADGVSCPTATTCVFAGTYQRSTTLAVFAATWSSAI